MSKKKILAVFGTRPEAIKMVPIIKELKKYTNEIELTTVSTGQHKEMLKQVMDIFSLTPDIELDLMTANQTLPKLTSKLFDKLDDVIVEKKPDWIIAQGDTATVLVSSMLAFFHKIKFAHVEAGLRTDNINSPFPEEFNRRVTTLTADASFAPTEYCADILRKENISEDKIIVTGNTVVDTLLEVSSMPHESAVKFPVDKKLVLVTAHRRENFDSMYDMFSALAEIAKKHSDIHIIYPVHLNPNVKDKATEILSGISNVELIAPLAYFDFIHLMKQATIILTDSGGIQEEAPSFGIPVLIMRENTERPEGVRAGVSFLVGNKKESIIDGFESIYSGGLSKHNKPNPYGDGKSSQKIAKFLLEN